MSFGAFPILFVPPLRAACSSPLSCLLLPFELPAPFVVAKNDGRKSIIMDCFFWLFAFFLFILHIENRSDYFIFRNKQIIS